MKKAHDDFSISVKYYTPVTCFLTFNLCSVLGNLIPNLLTFVSIFRIFIAKKKKKKYSYNRVRIPFIFFSVTAISKMGIHSGDAAILIPAIFLTLQLSTSRGRTFMAGFDALGLRLLGGYCPFWINGRLCFLLGYDVLPKVYTTPCS